MHGLFRFPRHMPAIVKCTLWTSRQTCEKQYYVFQAPAQVHSFEKIEKHSFAVQQQQHATYLQSFNGAASK